MPLVFSKDDGAVTAEFMLLTPTVIAALAGALGLFQLGVARLELAQLAFYQARSQAIGLELDETPGVRFETEVKGQFLCVSASRRMLITLRESGCYLIHGA